MEKGEKKAAPKEEQKKNPAPAAPEIEYDVTEFAAASENLFGAAPECVTAAFRLEGRTKATKKEAERIVSAFLKKEVK